MDWIVYYGDGSSISSAEAKPHEIPRWGVICIVVPSPDHGRILWCGKDFFWWSDGTWLNGDYVGLLDYLTNVPGAEKIVLMGRCLSAQRWHAVCKLALEDPRLPKKTSTDWLEQTEI
jgi:hypothetical protein